MIGPTRLRSAGDEEQECVESREEIIAASYARDFWHLFCYLSAPIEDEQATDDNGLRKWFVLTDLHKTPE